MNATELRIGNLLEVYLEPQISEWIEIHIHLSNLGQIQEDSRKFRPIPLTEEWLLKFGFSKLYDGFELKLDNHWSKMVVMGDMSFSLQDANGSDDVAFQNDILDSVHRLQNLYFALTGEELTITQP